jgi:hypothetical protein
LRRAAALLAAAVVARMAFHALYLPAFEGPDEPQHLARIADFAQKPWPEAFAGKQVDAVIVASVLAHPCPRPEIGCPSYASTPGTFNLLRAPAVSAAPAAAIPNEESKQPPLFYLAAGLPLRLLGLRPDSAGMLLYARLFSVLLVAIALWGPLRRIFEASPAAAAAGLIALLSPGAAEAFARCSNDAAVFLWAAAVLAALERRPAPAVMALLLAAGPMLKLTALPVAAFAAGTLWFEGRRAAALGGATASLLVFPVQALRGWIGGGALELHRDRPEIVETVGGWIAGFAQTAYTLVKAPFWAMGWRLLRPPDPLLAVHLGLVLAFVLALRFSPRPRRVGAHLLAASVVVAGTVVFAVATRRYFGAWGGVTGWYVWDWSPWLAVAALDLFRIERRFVRPLLAVEALLVCAANVVWLRLASSAYGG